jgi:hypothetical protein
MKVKIRKTLKDEELTLIIVSDQNSNAFFWFDSGKEFRYKGEMYDVVKTIIKDKSTYYYCINDKKENELIALFHKNNTTKKDKNNLLKRVFSVVPFPKQNLSISINPPFYFVYYFIEFKYKLDKLKISTPPPKIA